MTVQEAGDHSRQQSAENPKEPPVTPDPHEIVDEYGRLVGAGNGLFGAHVGPVVPPPPGSKRSSRWPTVLKKFLAATPLCGGCGRKAETAHHVTPFGVDEAKELDPLNLAAVCVPCHFVLCHGGNWHNYVPQARESLANHLTYAESAAPIHDRS